MRSAAAAFATLTALAAVAQVPPRLGYQGRLLRTDGTPETGVVSMAFWIYDVATGGATLGCDQLQVALSDGYYSVALGGIGACPGGPPAIGMASFDGKELFLEIFVGGTALSPRQRIQSVPYAIRSGTAVNVRGGTVEASTVTVGGPGGVSISQTGISVGTNSVVDSSGKATVATGAGLTGDGSTGSPLAVAFGTAAGTAAAGNDPRLSDARTPLPGSAAYIQSQTTIGQPASFSIAGTGSLRQEGTALSLYHATSGGHVLMNLHSNVNEGSDRGFLLLQDDSANVAQGAGSTENARLTLGLYNDADGANGEELWLQGAQRLVSNACPVSPQTRTASEDS